VLVAGQGSTKSNLSPNFAASAPIRLRPSFGSRRRVQQNSVR
jgi:hypothetical protein